MSLTEDLDVLRDGLVNREKGAVIELAQVLDVWTERETEEEWTALNHCMVALTEWAPTHLHRKWCFCQLARYAYIVGSSTTAEHVSVFETDHMAWIKFTGSAPITVYSLDFRDCHAGALHVELCIDGKPVSSKYVVDVDTSMACWSVCLGVAQEQALTLHILEGASTEIYVAWNHA